MIDVELSVDDRERLEGVLDIARQRGFVGPGPLGPHIDHALGFAPLLPAQLSLNDNGPSGRRLRALDLGSGAGLPGIVLAMYRPDSLWTLLDSNEARTVFLAEAVEALDLDARVSVLRGRAEDVAHDERLRGVFDVVTARSFGPPSVVAECAAGFLAIGAVLIVSEPPEWDPDRWNAPVALRSLGMVAAPGVGQLKQPGPRLQVVRQADSCPVRFPRRVGVPAKRPLF